MARRKHVSAPPRLASQPAEALNPAPSQVEFVRIFSKHLVFEEVETSTPPQPRAPGTTPDVETQVKIAVTLDSEKVMTAVTFHVTVVPDVAYQPYRVEVELVGLFKGTGSTTADALNEFARHSVPTIMFPYVREAVSRLTADGRFGSVRLRPTNIQAQLNWGEAETSVK